MKWQYHLIMAILIAVVLAAGCTGDEPPAPAQPATGPVEPGQALFVIGDVTGNGILHGTIDTITFTIGLVPGENPVNLENVSIIYADAIRSETLIPVEGYRGNPPRGTWGLLSVNGELGAANNRIEYEEQFVIRINPTAPLVPRQMITIIVQPPEGTSLAIRRVSPATIIAENNILSPV